MYMYVSSRANAILGEVFKPCESIRTKKKLEQIATANATAAAAAIYSNDRNKCIKIKISISSEATTGTEIERQRCEEKGRN